MALQVPQAGAHLTCFSDKNHKYTDPKKAQFILVIQTIYWYNQGWFLKKTSQSVT
jgi:hypothetical protein